MTNFLITIGNYIKILGAVIIMMTTSAHAAPTFNLKSPQYYFWNPKTVALIAAAMTGDPQKAEWLVSEGADPNEEGPRDNPYNRLRPLHYAIAANNREAVKVLIEVGADPELSAQGFGRSFLFAMTLENLDIISLLFDLRPINTLSRDTIDFFLFEAVRQPCQKCLELALNRGAPIDFPDQSGYTTMMRAMDCQDYDMAEWLLLRGASVHVEPRSGMTPAYSVEFHLNKFIPDSPTYNKVLHLKKLMEERGAVFPAQTPAEVRARREKH